MAIAGFSTVMSPKLRHRYLLKAIREVGSLSLSNTGFIIDFANATRSAYNPDQKPTGKSSLLVRDLGVLVRNGLLKKVQGEYLTDEDEVVLRSGGSVPLRKDTFYSITDLGKIELAKSPYAQPSNVADDRIEYLILEIAKRQYVDLYDDDFVRAYCKFTGCVFHEGKSATQRCVQLYRDLNSMVQSGLLEDDIVPNTSAPSVVYAQTQKTSWNLSHKGLAEHKELVKMLGIENENHN